MIHVTQLIIEFKKIIKDHFESSLKEALSITVFWKENCHHVSNEKLGYSEEKNQQLMEEEVNN
ncbi:MAG: hypothetical protein KMY55_15205 [Dethiosulfatibacter sp.]|nr:hypothetical protein [Dethiosulfatibacter sp.]